MRHIHSFSRFVASLLVASCLAPTVAAHADERSLSSEGPGADHATGDAPATVAGSAAGFTVVLDPGHGGSNLGAPGSVPGVFEKKVTLAVARLVRKRLEKDGVRVVITRDNDTYLTLGERVRRANAAAGDVFISLHANATPEHKRRGFDAYLLSREVVDIEARKAGERVTELTDPAEAVVARARVRQVALQSAELARSLRDRMGRVRSTDRGTRQAPFDVLEGLRMPAALLEVGYIDHVDEGPELLRPETLHAIADAVAEGIEAFAASHNARAAAQPAANASSTTHP